MDEEMTTGGGGADEGDGTTTTTTSGVEDSLVKVPEAETDRTTTGTEATGMEARGTDTATSSLLETNSADYRRRWEDIQANFVDRPRESVEEADRLVIDVVQQLQASFTRERDRLESQWRAGTDVSTEDLRVALQRYRSFFDRLLAA